MYIPIAYKSTTEEQSTNTSSPIKSDGNQEELDNSADQYKLFLGGLPIDVSDAEVLASLNEL